MKKNKGIITRLLTYTKPYAPLLALSFVCSAIYVALTLTVPVIIGRAVDRIADAGRVDFDALPEYIFQLCAATAGAALMQWLTSYIGSIVTGRTVRDLRVRLFDKLTTLPPRDIDGIAHGRIVNTVTNDVDAVSDGLLTAATQLFTGCAAIAGTLVFMAAINIYIAAAVVLLTPLSLVVAAVIARFSYRNFSEQAALQSELASCADGLLHCRETVLAYNYSDSACERFNKINAALAVCGLRAQFWSAMTNPSTRFVNALVYAAAGILGAMTAVSGGISVGQISTFLIYAGQYTKPFNEISGIIAQLQSAAAAAARIFDIIDMPDETENNASARSLSVEGSVEFDHVGFSYTPGKPLIRDFCLSVKAGCRAAVVGQTGSGKTTIINLLMRFLEAEKGSIKIDGTDINHISRKALRSNIGMVLQDSWLFSGTVRDNIAYGKPDATEAEIENAARLSHAHSFIMRLPDGYNTIIGDSHTLSFGQTQLICIARVMLADPPLLILDEATSGIDARTELRVQEALSALMRGKTSIVVAHRLTTIKNSDIIIVMSGGEIAEQGTHEQLIEKGGIYTKLYRAITE
jgi:ATP-binding cassette subfamily B multidrug efflux pump